MTNLLLGLVLFMGIHSLPLFPDLRGRMVDRLGELPYKAVFSVIALAGFVLIVVGKGAAPYVVLWEPPYFLYYVTKLLMLPACIFIVAAYVPSNIRLKIRHPMLLAVKCWALGHLFANGDLASLILFVSFLAYAVIDMVVTNKRKPWNKPEPKPPVMTVLVIMLGLAVYIGLAMMHLRLFGVPIV